MNILEIQSSARTEASITRRLTRSIINRLSMDGEADVQKRNLLDVLPFVTHAWIEHAETERRQSMVLIEELKRADAVVVGLPIYNFGVPASFKAWFDLVAIAGTTFKYKEGWPEGLLADRPTWVVVGSDGVARGSDFDFATPWLRTAFNMIGIKDIYFIDADQHLLYPSRLEQAEAVIAEIEPLK